MSRVLGVITLLSLLIIGVGCGPIVSGVQIVNASIELRAAKTAGAGTHAQYEYIAAQEYLQKAREENAYSDFWAARKYADKALDYAMRARKKAEALSAADRPVALPPP